MGGRVGWGPGGRAGPAQGARPPTWPPTKAGLLAGQATMYVGSPPCMGSVPHHAFGFPTMYLNQRYQVSCIILNQAVRKEMKAFEKTHARAVRKLPINSWEQGPS